MVWGQVKCAVMWDGVNWTEETAALKKVSIRRGMSDDFASVNAGECTLTLRDTTGHYNAQHAASTLQPYIAQPLRPVHVWVEYGVGIYDLFVGYTRRHKADPARSAREATLTCSDAFLQLSRTSPVIDGGPPAPIPNTGQAIEAVLSACGVTNPFGGAVGVFDPGDDLYDALAGREFSPDGSKTGLALIADLLASERGFFFMAAGGQAIYYSRYGIEHSQVSHTQQTISNIMSALGPGVDIDLVRNRATVTRTGGAAQTAEDAASVALYGPGDYPALTTPYLADDSQALALAQYLVLKGKDPGPPVSFLDLGNGTDAAYRALLSADLGDRATIADTLGGTSGTYHIASITHDISAVARLHSTSWGLIKIDNYQPAFWDTTNWDSTTEVWTY